MRVPLITSTLLLLFAVIRPAVAEQPVLTEDEKAIVAKLRTLRNVPDKMRGQVTRDIALDIRKLPPDAGKLGLANGLAGLSTEGDFGSGTLQEVATTLAAALQEQSSPKPEPYSELARLIRYEHVKVSLTCPQLSEALSTLEANDRDRADANFTLRDLNGNSWTLKELQNHVVLVNFWATWCPPCRKEMPDLDALYHHFKKQGLIVLAISDEDPATVNSFLAQHGVSYPVLIDSGRKVNELFHVEGIPKSFVYDRQGHLAAQAIDMRTRDQFLALLSQAGLANHEKN